MPRLGDLEFARDALLVSYRASAEPQDIDIYITTAGRASDAGGAVSLRMLLDAINGGAAGGSVFPPSAGWAELVSGPWMGPDALGPSYHWTLRVSGVAPLFLRTLVEDLRRVGWEHPVTGMQIVGSLPLDGSALSVREAHVRAWLEDDTSYVDAWPALGFHVSDGVSRDAQLRVALAGPIVPDVRHALEALCVNWVNVTRNYVSDEGEEIDFNPLLVLPRFGRGKSELCARADGYRCKRGPARAVLLNLLQRFHERVSPIVELEVRL